MSVWTRDNLILAMLTGFKRNPGGDSGIDR
jgi:cytochrome b